MSWGSYAGSIPTPPANNTDTGTFAFRLPTYSGDANVWGNGLNGNWTCLDLILADFVSVSVGPTKLTWALAKTGGTLTGNVLCDGASLGTAAKPATSLEGKAWNVRATDGGAVTASCTAAGVITGSDVVASCDARLKRDIENADLARLFAGVMGLMPKLYTRIGSGPDRELGFVAQDVQHHLPECVGHDSEGNLTISQTRLIAAIAGAFIYAMKGLGYAAPVVR